MGVFRRSSPLKATPKQAKLDKIIDPDAEATALHCKGVLSLTLVIRLSRNWTPSRNHLGKLIIH